MSARESAVAGKSSGLVETIIRVCIIGCTTLLLFEAILWVTAPLVDPYEPERVFSPFIRREHKANETQRYLAEPGLPGMEGISVWTTNNVGFRGDDLAIPKPANEYRIFLIGGSTTECLILDDEASIDAIVQDALQQRVGSNREIKVYNAGISGDRSDDHVAMLTQRIVHMEPDMIVVFSGINDLRAQIEGHDYLHFPTPAKPAWMLLATRSQLGRLGYYLAKGRRPALLSSRREPIETAYQPGVELLRLLPLAASVPRLNVEAYANNLTTIAGVAAGHGIPLIFMTQQTTWNSELDPDASEWHWLLAIDNVRYAEADLDRAMEMFNDAMRQTAESMRLPLYDLARQMPKSTEYFYDDVHFNNKGAREAGMALAQLVIQEWESGLPGNSAL